MNSSPIAKAMTFPPRQPVFAACYLQNFRCSSQADPFHIDEGQLPATISDTAEFSICLGNAI
jgi:hypothetical protein